MGYLTEKELIERFQYYTVQLEGQLLRGDDFNALCDAIPFAVHLNDSNNLELVAANRSHTEQLGYQVDEIHEMGLEFLDRCVHPKSLAVYPLLLQRSKQQSSSVFTFIHHILYRTPKPDYTPVITFTKPTNLPGGLSICLSPLPHNFGSMVDKINQVIEVDDFKLKNFSRFRCLTPRERDILGLLSHGYNNPQISEQLGISRQTVETHRKKLKAKLDIRSFRDLMRYALAFDLVTF